MNVVVITGASGGIGAEFARQLDNGLRSVDEFWLIGRNEIKLNKLAKALKHDVRIFLLDVTDELGLDEFEGFLTKYDAKVRMLINCAGYGIVGNFARADREGTLGMIRTNCEALTSVTHRLIPYMRRNSRIIQLASSAAFLPQQDFAVYAASKAYVHSFTRALNRELKERRIYVTSVCPGPVDTDFFALAELRGKSVFEFKKYTMASPEAVVQKALRDSVCKREVSVYGVLINMFNIVSKLFPHKCILDLLALYKRIHG